MFGCWPHGTWGLGVWFSFAQSLDYGQSSLLSVTRHCCLVFRVLMQDMYGYRETNFMIGFEVLVFGPQSRCREG